MGQVCVSYYNEESNFEESQHLTRHDEEFLISLETQLGFENVYYEVMQKVSSLRIQKTSGSARFFNEGILKQGTGTECTQAGGGDPHGYP